MTICAAVICRNGRERAVVGIADRRLTVGRPDQEQTQYDSRNQKICWFPRSLPWGFVACLDAGESDFSHEITQATRTQVEAANEQPSVNAIAELYASNLAERRRRRIEQGLLVPFGLTLNQFVAGEHGLPEQVATDTAQNINHQSWDLGTQAIIAGFDSDVPHIYHVYDPGTSVCRERAGFYSIGSGKPQFDSVMMAAGYDSGWPMLRAMLLMFSAKRRAEMAPGVGRETDMMIITPMGHRFLSPTEVNCIARRHASVQLAADNLEYQEATALGSDLPGFPGL